MKKDIKNPFTINQFSDIFIKLGLSLDTYVIDILQNRIELNIKPQVFSVEVFLLLVHYCTNGPVGLSRRTYYNGLGRVYVGDLCGPSRKEWEVALEFVKKFLMKNYSTLMVGIIMVQQCGELYPNNEFRAKKKGKLYPRRLNIKELLIVFLDHYKKNSILL
ncbi:hypothetical protein TBLA_0A06850 [Henningerozyma blattae CBS 6284]|uniref:Uncharacterized protein n=1 Tax=Henningerozyma blattae (strain ATCC 34711 / CBS 6284 / DSM 70876 / NBRC 10599 / NRRL Y-10934 / UCD 77-7) TaxID=1071380 RepID=I2GWH5_HENB6|nr:hypothetical protein TBLA_0A06850 [Tetrapisispora blattae CBS 6284]CCH58477.1 hypothetical protein TBLA_0A06850 [Tetrapisispora blattae CBS 6284]